MPKKRTLIDPVEIGSKGGRARAVSLSASDLQESGRSAAKIRWDGYFWLHPEKLQATKEPDAKKAKAAEQAEPVVPTVGTGIRLRSKFPSPIGTYGDALEVRAHVKYGIHRRKNPVSLEARQKQIFEKYLTKR
jgi:hypothetical protein